MLHDVSERFPLFSNLSVEPTLGIQCRGLRERIGSLHRAELMQGIGFVGGALGSLNSSSEVALIYERRLGERWLVSPRAAFGIADVSDRGLAYEYRAGVLELGVFRRLPFSGMEVRFGPTAGGVYARQRLLSGELQSGVVTRVGGALGLELPLAGRLRATIGWTMGGAFLRLNDDWTARLFVRADLGVGYGF